MKVKKTLSGVPQIWRDLIKRRLYLVPNSIVVSRGCRTCVTEGDGRSDSAGDTKT
jgi:hypothetical protein